MIIFLRKIIKKDYTNKQQEIATSLRSSQWPTLQQVPSPQLVWITKNLHEQLSQRKFWTNKVSDKVEHKISKKFYRETLSRDRRDPTTIYFNVTIASPNVIPTNKTNTMSLVATWFFWPLFHQGKSNINNH